MRSRRARGEGTIYFDRSKRQWFGSFDDGKTIDGKRVRRKVTGKTMSAVAERLHILRAKSAERDAIGTSRARVSTALDGWLDWVRCNLRLKTYEYYELQVRRHIPTELKVKRLSEVDRPAAISALSSISSKMRSQGAKRKTFVTMRTAFQFFTDQGMLKANPFVLPRAITPRSPRATPNPKALTSEQERTFLELVRGHGFEALFVLALDSGCRQGELWALTWADINWDLRLLNVDKQLSEDRQGNRSIGPLKGGDCRAIEISSVSIALLKRLRVSRAHESARGFIFTAPDGGSLRKSNFHRRIYAPIFASNEAIKLGIDRFPFHRLRHTCATRLLEEGEYIITVQERLGHRDVRTTLAFYAHAVPGGQQSAASRFDQRIRAYSVVAS